MGLYQFHRRVSETLQAEDARSKKEPLLDGLCLGSVAAVLGLTLAMLKIRHSGV